MNTRTRVERAVARTLVGLPRPVLRAIAGPARRSPEGFALDPQIQSLVRLMQLRDGEDMHTRGLRAARRRLDHNGSLLAAPTFDVTTQDRRVRRSSQGRGAGGAPSPPAPRGPAAPRSRRA